MLKNNNRIFAIEIFRPMDQFGSDSDLYLELCTTHMLAASQSPFPALCVLSSSHHCSQRLFYIAKQTALRSSIRVHFSFTFTVFKSIACIVGDMVKMFPTTKRSLCYENSY